jgi:hypothetical protein
MSKPDEDFGMSGRFGFAPNADLREYNRWHFWVSLGMCCGLYGALVIIHLVLSR